ncbi:MAG: CMD domain-containing protein [Bosea sp. (in: a-proteobacteria)]|uniref:CMD domain-containing protein n=1 Tax=Bosea sp. (in: a-proteobacteria) TaxID=1871050 RepID=UPI003F7B8123
MTLIEDMAGISPGTPFAEALAARADILRLSQASHDAVLLPKETGGLGHGLRAALAARMARQNSQPPLAAHYDALMRSSGEMQPNEVVPVERTRVAAIVAHSDLLTLRPRVATRHDIEALKAAGVSEPDIVRLAELAAFVNYQARVIRRLQALGELKK